MKRTAIIFALFSELLPVARSLNVPFLRRIKSQIILDSKAAALVRSGVGREKATKATEGIIREFHPEVIISAGFCGALVEDLSVGDIIVSDFSDGKIFCSPKPLFTFEEKQAAHRNHKALVVDMESEGVKTVAKKYNVPFIAVKAVSDGLRDDILKFPFVFTSIPKLARFKQAMDIASKHLCEFLLDYIKEITPSS